MLLLHCIVALQQFRGLGSDYFGEKPAVYQACAHMANIFRGRVTSVKSMLCENLALLSTCAEILVSIIFMALMKEVIRSHSCT